ncbi:MAG: shikimate kinase, partial [Chloroflexi bacterium]|nr:shikimate kinase [Chloroflexota bacterium]
MSEHGTGVVLVGLPGSGKSTVGRCLAQRTGRPFVDLDESITASTGRTPAEHIDGRGEETFRQLERQAVLDACRSTGAVIATGGGAVIDPLNRWAFMGHGIVCWLDAPLESLLERLSADVTVRPLLDGHQAARLAGLAQARAPYYRAADVRIDAAESAEVVTSRVIAAV